MNAVAWWDSGLAACMLRRAASCTSVGWRRRAAAFSDAYQHYPITKDWGDPLISRLARQRRPRRCTLNRLQLNSYPRLAARSHTTGCAADCEAA
jgi:hypothetical protein